MALRVAGATAEEGDDADVAAADSPWLERQRMWGARIKRLNFLELRGLLVRVDRVNQLMAAVGSLFRSRLDNLCDNCRAIAEQTLDDAAAQYEQELPQVGELGEDDYELLDADDGFDDAGFSDAGPADDGPAGGGANADAAEPAP